MVSFSTGIVRITRVLPSSVIKEEIDSSRLEEEMPSIFEKYRLIKPVDKKGYLIITPCKGDEI